MPRSRVSDALATPTELATGSFPMTTSYVDDQDLASDGEATRTQGSERQRDATQSEAEAGAWSG
jgi:hypothetical protein